MNTNNNSSQAKCKCKTQAKNLKKKFVADWNLVLNKKQTNVQLVLYINQPYTIAHSNYERKHNVMKARKVDSVQKKKQIV